MLSDNTIYISFMKSYSEQFWENCPIWVVLDTWNEAARTHATHTTGKLAAGKHPVGEQMKVLKCQKKKARIRCWMILILFASIFIMDNTWNTVCFTIQYSIYWTIFYNSMLDIQQPIFYNILGVTRPQWALEIWWHFICLHGLSGLTHFCSDITQTYLHQMLWCQSLTLKDMWERIEIKFPFSSSAGFIRGHSEHQTGVIYVAGWQPRSWVLWVWVMTLHGDLRSDKTDHCVGVLLLCDHWSMSLWWLQMAWHQIGARPSATIIQTWLSIYSKEYAIMVSSVVG